MDKALIVKTGEVVTIQHSIHQVEYIFDINEATGKIKVHESAKGKSEYLLSNGETRIEDEVIVGLENIREWKIKQLENGKTS